MAANKKVKGTHFPAEWIAALTRKRFDWHERAVLFKVLVEWQPQNQRVSSTFSDHLYPL